MSVLVVGSIALDDIKTPTAERKDILGGSASYAAVSASYFGPVRMVGVVGKDFPENHVEYFKNRNIDLTGLEIADGKTFRWSGEYMEDMNTRETLSVELNVFGEYMPTLPDSYKTNEVVLLGNIGPDLQHAILDQSEKPGFVIADTMDLWIEIAHDRLKELISRVDMLILNDGEAQKFTGKHNLIKAGKDLRALGPKYVAIKKGEHGCILFGENEFFSIGAFPLEEVHDPTGAGDTFAGAVAGFLAHNIGASGITDELIRRSIVHGSVMASFNVEAFGFDRLRELKEQEVADRYAEFVKISRFS